MTTPAKRRITPEEYLEIERHSEGKSEYLGGEIFAMTGASRQHNLISTNLSRELSQALRSRPCEVYSSDLRVHIPTTGLYIYPDVAVVCGPAQFEDALTDSLLNPTWICEILSPTTEAYDRGKKFEHYAAIESLREYVLVSQEAPRVEQYVRQGEGRWLFSATAGLAARVVIPSLECELTLAEVYLKVFSEP